MCKIGFIQWSIQYKMADDPIQNNGDHVPCYMEWTYSEGLYMYNMQFHNLKSLGIPWYQFVQILYFLYFFRPLIMMYCILNQIIQPKSKHVPGLFAHW